MLVTAALSFCGGVALTALLGALRVLKIPGSTKTPPGGHSASLPPEGLSAFSKVLAFLGREATSIADHMTGEKEQLKIQAATITASSEQIEANVRIVSAASQSAREASRRASESADQTLAQMIALTEASQEIDGILQTMTMVARQTHLLSINASIEAAQAGAYGAGFEVIAEEVRVLAAETRSASDAIEEKIKAIHDTIRQTHTGAEQLRESNRLLSEINATIALAVGSTELGSEGASAREHLSDSSQIEHLRTLIGSQTNIAQNVTAVHGNLREMARSINQLNEETFLSQKSGRDLNKVIGNLQSYLKAPVDGFHTLGRGQNTLNSRVRRGDVIRIGVIYSQTGVMGLVEREQYRVALMFIDQVNRNGGINGARLEAVVRNPASNWDAYARHAQELVNEGVRIFWACYTSASREAILPVIETSGSVLFYPTYYEGRECSPNVILTGSCPNQQAARSIPWMMERFGEKAFFIGSDYLYPRTMHATSKLLLRDAGGEVLGDRYIPMEAEQVADFDQVVDEIRRARPHWVFSNVVGASSVAFMRAFRKAGLTATEMPILSCPLTEPEVAAAGVENCEGHFTSFTYFQTVDREVNRRFVRAYQQFVQSRPDWRGEKAVTSGVMQASYVGMMACAKAIQRSGSQHPKAIIEACRGMRIPAPEEDVRIDPETQHTWLRPRIGQVRSDGLFKIVDESQSIVEPIVFDPRLDQDRACHGGGLLHLDGTAVLPRDREMTANAPAKAQMRNRKPQSAETQSTSLNGPRPNTKAQPVPVGNP